MSPLSSHRGGGGWPGGAGGLPPGPPGGGANHFGDGSDGHAVIAADTSLTSTLDGDMVVRNYASLTISAGATLTVSNRCKGLIINVLGDLAVNGTISMTGRGAAVDPVAAGVSVSGLALRWRAVDGPPLGAAPDLAGCGAAALAWAARFGTVPTGVEALVPRLGGSGGVVQPETTGGTGGAVPNGLGGGGAGGERTDIAQGVAGAGAAATCFSGGSGGGGTGDGDSTLSTAGTANGGAGGGSGHTSRSGGSGAGNPAGACFGPKPIGAAQDGQDGTGGLLILNVRGNVSIASGGLVSAHGRNGGAAPNSTGGGGGSGGGRVIIAHGGGYTNAGTVAANGGAGGPRGEGLGANAAGGPGGAGAVSVHHVKP